MATRITKVSVQPMETTNKGRPKIESDESKLMTPVCRSTYITLAFFFASVKGTRLFCQVLDQAGHAKGYSMNAASAKV